MIKTTRDVLWRFSASYRIEECSFNKVLEKFYDLGISGLVRENVQNSLDGKIPEEIKPVIVTIKTGTIKKEMIPGFNEIRERILCLEGRNNYTKETIEHMKNKMHQDEVAYISFEDYNTKGLKGAKNGESDSKEDTWGIYAYSKGIHFEENDKEMEKLRGGSHGIGKIASNAASDLYMMYFANCDEEGNKHLGGTVQLIEHKYMNKYYRSTGYFTDVKQIEDNTIRFYPFENTFHEVFEKNTRGLKIVIPFLREQFNNEKDIIKSICDNFFIAILEKKLQVIVNDKKIDNTTIKNYILNKDYYIQAVGDIKKEFTPLYFNTYENKKPMPIKISDRDNEYNFKLYFNYDEEISKGRIAVIRTIGMKIEDKKIKGNVNKPFNGVLIPESITEDAFLKSLENESHTKLTYEHIKDQKLQNNAKRFINNMSKVIAKIIEDEITKTNPTDGIMNTKDILYTVENQFKQDLSKTISKVKLNKDGKKQTIIKAEGDIPKEKNKQKKHKRKEPKEKRPAKKINRKVSYEDEISKEKEGRYSTNTDIVKRLIINNNEYITFDFSQSEEVKKAKLCDIVLVVVDGMGEECSEKFILNDNYEYVIDKITGKECKIENNKVNDVKIVKGIAQIKLKTKPIYNKALKFVYYVEV